MLHDLNQLLLTNAILNTGVSASFGFLLGFLGSFLFWRYTAHLQPKVGFENDISKVKVEAAGLAAGYKYNIKFWNAGRRNINDIEISARLKIKNLDQNPKVAGNYSFFSIPLGYSRLPTIVPETTKEEALTRMKTTATHKTFLQVTKIEELQIADYANHIITKLRENEAIRQHLDELNIAVSDSIKGNPYLLEHLMSLGDEAFLEVTIFGYDDYSSTRKVFAHIYTRENIKGRYFRKKPRNKASHSTFA